MHRGQRCGLPGPALRIADRNRTQTHPTTPQTNIPHRDRPEAQATTRPKNAYPSPFSSVPRTTEKVPATPPKTRNPFNRPTARALPRRAENTLTTKEATLLQLSRGSKAAETSPQTAPRWQQRGSFNWAAAAETVHRSPGPGAASRFNWAAARRPRRRDSAGYDQPPGGLASIGPRLGGRGDNSFLNSVAFDTTELQLGRGSEAAETESCLRFVVTLAKLQLGRGSEAAETGHYRLDDHRTPACFNWAAARRPRRPLPG